MKPTIVLSSLLLIALCHAQNSYETQISYLIPNKIKDINSFYDPAKTERRFFDLNLGYNITGNKRFTFKAGLALHSENYRLNHSHNYTYEGSDFFYSEHKEINSLNLQFAFMTKFNLIRSTAFSFSPQIGFNLGLFSFEQSHFFFMGSHYPPWEHTSLATRTNKIGPDIFLLPQFGFQAEKRLTENTALIFDLNYTRYWYYKQHEYSYNADSDTRFSLGIRSKVNFYSGMKDKPIFHAGISVIKSFHYFINHQDSYFLPSYAYFTGNKSEINDQGINFSSQVSRNNFLLYNDFSVSKISTLFQGGKTYHFLYKMPNPFLVGQADTYSFDYASEKLQFEYNFGLGYSLLRKTRFHIVPGVGYYIQSTRKPRILKNEFTHHIYQELEANPNNPGSGIFIDTLVHHNANEYLTDNASKNTGLRLSLSFTYQFSSRLFSAFRIHYYRITLPQMRYEEITESYHYRFEFGFYYQIRTSKD